MYVFVLIIFAGIIFRQLFQHYKSINQVENISKQEFVDLDKDFYEFIRKSFKFENKLEIKA